MVIAVWFPLPGLWSSLWVECALTDSLASDHSSEFSQFQTWSCQRAFRIWVGTELGHAFILTLHSLQVVTTNRRACWVTLCSQQPAPSCLVSSLCVRVHILFLSYSSCFLGQKSITGSAGLAGQLCSVCSCRTWEWDQDEMMHSPLSWLSCSLWDFAILQRHLSFLLKPLHESSSTSPTPEAKQKQNMQFFRQSSLSV